MASITLKNVRKTFGQVIAVADVSLEIADSEFVAFLGPSGCGKTTTLRIISGLEAPDSGTILIGDRDVTGIPPRARDVAMVFQDYALYPHMTIHDNIGYPLKVRGIAKPDITQQVTDVAANLQIANLLDRRPAQLSGGQQQRTALARAVVHRAQVYLFDEPLSNLDAKLRLEARAFLKYLQREVGVTAVYVTHDQAEAMALADRIVVMQSGRIMQVGTPQEIYRRPANTFVASFIGSPPMNLLPCRLKGDQLLIEGTQDRAMLSVGDIPLPADLDRDMTFTLGVRPEHITPHSAPLPGSLAGQLYVTQTLGSETLLIVKLGEHLLSVRIFGDDLPQLPEQVWLRFDPGRVFFYDAEGALLG